MRKLLLSLATLLSAGIAGAQSFTADFEALPLSGNDTFYVNKVNPNTDAGFDNGNLHFPYMYDSSFGGYWAGGFAYSNKKDSVTSGAANMYSAKAASGANGSAKYLVYNPGYSSDVMIRLTNRQKFAPQTVQLTNSTFAYNSMRDGDMFAKKFGGTSGNDSDWFRLTIFAWSNGQRKADSINFYLADYRYANNSLDYIVKDWRSVTLGNLGLVDSLSFNLTSSDNGSFGMNTPAYFCLDNLNIFIPTTGIPASGNIARVYPNPAADVLNVDLIQSEIREARVLDMSGRLVGTYIPASGKLQIPTSALAPGTYVLQLVSDNVAGTVRFVKK